MYVFTYLCTYVFRVELFDLCFDQNGYVSTDSTKMPMFLPNRPKLAIFRRTRPKKNFARPCLLKANYVSTDLTQIVYFSTNSTEQKCI